MRGVYLLHFGRRLRHAGHYLGWSPDIPRRVKRHLSGQGARLVAVVLGLGIPVELARTWEGERDLERRLKGRKASPRLCPLCRAQRS